MAEWTLEDVGGWLSKIGLAEYKRKFQEEHIHGGALEELHFLYLKASLSEFTTFVQPLQISRMGHLLLFQKELRKLFL